MVQINSITRQEYSLTCVASTLKQAFADYIRTSKEQVRQKDSAFSIYAGINNLLILAGRYYEQSKVEYDPKNNKPIGTIFYSSKVKPTPLVIAESFERNTSTFRSFSTELAAIRLNSEPIVVASPPTLFLNYWQIEAKIGERLCTLSYIPSSWAIVGDADRFKSLVELLKNKYSNITITTDKEVYPIKSAHHYVSYLNKIPLLSVIETVNKELTELKTKINQNKRSIDQSTDSEVIASLTKSLSLSNAKLNKLEEFINSSATYQLTAGFLTGSAVGKPTEVKEIYFSIVSKQLPWTMDMVVAINENKSSLINFSDEINQLDDSYVVYSPVLLNISRERLESGYFVTKTKLSCRISLILDGSKKIVNIMQIKLNQGETSYCADFKTQSSVLHIEGQTVQSVLEQIKSITCVDGVCSLNVLEETTLDSNDELEIEGFFSEITEISVEDEIEVPV